MMEKGSTVCLVLFIVSMMIMPLAMLLNTNAATVEAVEEKVDDYRAVPIDADSVAKAHSIDMSDVYGNSASDFGLRAIQGYNISDKASYYVGDWGKWWYNDTDPAGFMTFTKRAETRTCEIWVADDLGFMPGDPRNADLNFCRITDVQVQYIANEFENRIHPNMTDCFGREPPLDGENSLFKSWGEPYFPTNVTGSVMIMVFNIVDDSFWDPSKPYYWQGFFDPSVRELYDRNIIHVSCRDWAGSLGPGNGQFSYLYESIVTHEYEHLLNNWYNPWQATFLDEGCAAYSQLLMGYVPPYYYINEFLASPDNSLSVWLDQGFDTLADYGAAGLFVTYLSDHFGTELIGHLINTSYSGIPAVNAAFKNSGFSDWNFDKAFRYWRIANLIHSDTPGMGMYNYKSIDFSDPYIGRMHTIVYKPTSDGFIPSAAEAFGTTKTYNGLDTAVSRLNAYSTDYIHISGASPNSWSSSLDPFELKLKFAGESDVTQGWQRIKQGAWPSGWVTRSSGAESHPWSIAWDGGNEFYAIASSDSVRNRDPEFQFPMDEELLMTSGFSTMGSTNVRVSFLCDFESWYAAFGIPEFTSVGQLLISLDSGLTWTTHDLNLTTSYYGRDLWAKESIDLTWATEHPDVRLGFRYCSPLADISLRVDDIQVTGQNGGVIYSEDFDKGGVMTGWWSDSGDMIDYSLVGKADLREVTSANLSFESRWFLEGPYDFGFVQVSEDNGQTWTSLGNEYTQYEVFPDTMPVAVQNLPGLYGRQDSWVTMSFNLTDYVGEEVFYRFRTVTDNSWHFDGWYIKNITINGFPVNEASLSADPPRTADSWMVTVFLPGGYGTDGIFYLPALLEISTSKQPNSTLRALSSYTPYKDMYIIVSSTQNRMDYGFGIGNQRVLSG